MACPHLELGGPRLRVGSDQTIVHRSQNEIRVTEQLAVLPSHSTLTPGRPVLALTLSRQASVRAAARAPVFRFNSTDDTVSLA